MLKFQWLTPRATQQLLKDAPSLESYFDSLALLHDLVARMVPGEGGPRFAIADANQRLTDIRDSLSATVGAAVAMTIEDNRAIVMTALAESGDEDDAKSFVEEIVAAQRSVRRAAHFSEFGVRDSRDNEEHSVRLEPSVGGDRTSEENPAEIGTTEVVTAAQEKFFRDHYRYLIRIPMYFGADKEEAEDAVSSALVDTVRAWDSIKNPLKWASRAAVHHYHREKEKTVRVRDRLVEKGVGTAAAADDPQMSLWEDRQWVAQMLESLPPKQREVMRLVTEDLSPTEVADLLGRTSSAIRQNLLTAKIRLRRQMQDERVGEQPTSSASELVQKERPIPSRDDNEKNENYGKTAEVVPLESLLREVFDLVDQSIAV